ncbi:hypothetical protein [Kitasatospora sp. NPDC058190]|uniref:hypothetical protein n=1 Tax=Kitasatospora sp. NPDC058190 TaxID=3346371 RepID=UPI0036DD05B5
MTVTKVASTTAALAFAVDGGAVAVAWQDTNHRVGAAVADAAPFGGAAPAAPPSPGDVTWGG